MDIVAELSCDGVAPIGPCSAWPEERHYTLMKEFAMVKTADGVVHTDIPQISSQPKSATKVTAGLGKMAQGLIRSTAQAVANGKVSEEIRNERYETCQNCPFFIKDSKRCSECGCFMEAKTWIGGDPNALCPKQKWSR